MHPDKQRQWDIAHLRAATEYARLSHDPSTQVGAVLIEQASGNAVSIGINGRGRGRPNERISNEAGKSGCAHAEANCLSRAAINYALTYTLYVTHSPCAECAALILNSPITRVVYANRYRSSVGLSELAAGGIELTHIDLEDV